MYFCTDCGNHVCEDHSYFGSDGLERCARCNIRHERANAGPPPPPPPPGGGGGQGGPPGQGGSGSGGHGHAQFLDILAEVVGLLPGGTLVGHPDSMVALLMPMELGTISVVPVSMVLPTEVALATKGLALALVSPTILQVTLRVLRAAVILGQVLALATA